MRTVYEILNDLCHNTMGNPPYRIDQAKLLLKELVIEKLKEILKKREEERYGKLVIKPNIQPGHGSCCTCQVCGYNYDDCNCQIREAIKWIDQAISQIAEMFK